MNSFSRTREEFERLGYVILPGLFAREEIWGIDDTLWRGRGERDLDRLSRHPRLAQAGEAIGIGALACHAHAIDIGPVAQDGRDIELIAGIFLDDLEPCVRALLIAPGSHRIARRRTLDDVAEYLDWMASEGELEIIAGAASTAVLIDPRVFFMVTRSPSAHAPAVAFLGFSIAAAARSTLADDSLWPAAHLWTAG